MRLHRALLFAVLAAYAAGCGSSSPGGSTTAGAPAMAATPSGPVLTLPAVSRYIGNGVTAGLAEIAVMDQQSDDASGLADDLPKGTVRDVRCQDAAAGGWTCTVAWRDVDGSPQRTRYDAHAERAGRCLVAVAAPPRPTHYDATTRATAEDPLNTILSAQHGC